MKPFFVLSTVCALLVSFSSLAQTPQQLEMLKNRGMFDEESMPFVYKDEATGKMVIPVNNNKPSIALESGEIIPLPMAKTDREVLESHSGPNTYLMEQMTEEEQKKYIDYVVQDRIFLTTSDFEVVETGTGTKFCQLKLRVLNNTPRVLKQILLDYHWGTTSVPMEFVNIEPATEATDKIALAASVCDRITKKAKYTIKRCSMVGLSEDQCKIRLARQ